jgi:hypothetical protein
MSSVSASLATSAALQQRRDTLHAFLGGLLCLEFELQAGRGSSGSGGGGALSGTNNPLSPLAAAAAASGDASLAIAAVLSLDPSARARFCAAVHDFLGVQEASMEALRDADQRMGFQERLTQFYARFNPEKIPQVALFVEKWAGREAVLFAQVGVCYSAVRVCYSAVRAGGCCG